MSYVKNGEIICDSCGEPIDTLQIVVEFGLAAGLVPKHVCDTCVDLLHALVEAERRKEREQVVSE